MVVDCMNLEQREFMLVLAGNGFQGWWHSGPAKSRTMDNLRGQNIKFSFNDCFILWLNSTTVRSHLWVVVQSTQQLRVTTQHHPQPLTIEPSRLHILHKSTINNIKIEIEGGSQLCFPDHYLVMATAQQPVMSGAMMDYPEGNDNRGRLDNNNLPVRYPDLSKFGNDSDDGYDYDDDDDFQDAWEDIPNSAEAHQAAEALRQSKTIYNPVHPATATGGDNGTDETEADGIAMGVIPDHEARRWRERRMRLARYIQFVDGPTIDDSDVPAPLARWLDLDVDFGHARVDGAPHPVTAPVVKGGQGRGCMGSFLAARPAPGAGDLRKRREWVDIGADADGGAGAGPGPGKF